MPSNVQDHRMLGQFSHPIHLPMPHPPLYYCQMVNLHLLDSAMETAFYEHVDWTKEIETDCDKDNFLFLFYVR